MIRQRVPFANVEPNDPTSGERFDALCGELQGLERRGWITLALQRNYLTPHSKWYVAMGSLTREGEAALAETER